MDGVLRWRRDGDWGWRGGAVTATERAVATRLDRALRRLAILAETSLTGSAAGAEAPSSPLRCELRPPAALDAINEAELRLGAALPGDFRRFLMRTDGAVLASTATPAASLVLFGTRELVGSAEAAAVSYPSAETPEMIRFGAIGERGDGLAFDLTRLNPYGGCGVLDARAGSRPDQWWIIACDFTSWLLSMLRETCPPGSFGRDWSQDPVQLPLPFLVDPSSWLDSP